MRREERERALEAVRAELERLDVHSAYVRDESARRALHCLRRAVDQLAQVVANDPEPLPAPAAKAPTRLRYSPPSPLHWRST